MESCLVLEGGALRGLYTAGVLDTLMEEEIYIPNAIGVSAGTLFGLNYYSNQKGRALRYNKKYAKDKRYMSVRSLIFTGNFVNKDFAYYKMSNVLDPFDNETYMKAKKTFYATVTNIENGKPEYLKITNPLEQMEELRATSAIPLASRIIRVADKRYLDGGLSDSIPIKKAEKLGYDKIVVVLTQPVDYQKKPYSSKIVKLMKIKYRKYPKLIEDVTTRHDRYNETLEYVKELEKKKKIFVIRPSKLLDVKLNNSDPDKYQEIYDTGVADCKKILKKLKKFLEEE